MAVTWNREQTLRLIQLYKQFNCGSLLSRQEHKESLISIADNLRKIRPGTRIYDVKQKIKTIRSQYAKEKVKLKAYRKQNKVYKPRLWCYDLLTFFDDIDKKRLDQRSMLESLPKEEHDYCGSIADVNSKYELMEDKQQVTYLLDSIDSQKSESHSEIVREISDVKNYLSETGSYEETTSDVLETMNHFVNPKNPLEETQTEQINVSSHARNEAFATFICEEMSNIQDEEILESVKWTIQTILHNAASKILEGTGD